MGNFCYSYLRSEQHRDGVFPIKIYSVLEKISLILGKVKEILVPLLISLSAQILP
jgi:hypothetical protein